jgi:hypothetical protein
MIMSSGDNTPRAGVEACVTGILAGGDVVGDVLDLLADKVRDECERVHVGEDECATRERERE